METFFCFSSMSFVIWLFYKLIRKANEPPDDDADNNADEFDLMTVSEKFEIARKTNSDLQDMEQLITDLDLCSDDNQKIIQISWIGEDGENHEYDLYCNGTNLATECMQDIAQRETYDLRRVLSYQCDVLARATRSRKNGGKNGIETVGEWLENDAV